MATREGAECACANPNPNIDGRKANVNLAYLGAKPKNHSQPCEFVAVHLTCLKPLIANCKASVY